MLLFTILSTALAANPGIIKLDHAQHFTLNAAAKYEWQANQPSYSKGTVFVVQVDPKKAQVRQVGGPVLYVGSVPAARANPGQIDGHIVAFVPGHINLETTPIYWGPPGLPEQTTKQDGFTTLAQSDARPFSSVETAESAAPTIELETREHLYSHMADLIDHHAPADGDFAHGFRLAYGQ
ncbi:MAG: hypothetical protein ACPGTU_07655 [Myxococcota bacterium]